MSGTRKTHRTRDYAAEAAERVGDLALLVSRAPGASGSSVEAHHPATGTGQIVLD